ncbi:MAG: rhodanese-related sulfurtransferase [Candidatus Magasanikbacteria bacterium]|nr:rhodanese-related sulfurtransferase [Candidatus Magasanikbacteria bacterium]
MGRTEKNRRIGGFFKADIDFEVKITEYTYTMRAKKYTIILFYKFVRIDNPKALQKQQRKLCESLNLKGRLLIGKEGINGTFEGTMSAIKKYRAALRKDKRFADIKFKESAGFGAAFPKLKIKVREEIVTLKAGEFNVAKQTAKTITAAQLHKWYEKNEDFVVLDLRNSYEIQSGMFEKTIDPGLSKFRDLPEKLEELKEKIKGKKVVTVCTGGIRCEKATCLMGMEGFENLYQLKDGMHTYIVKYPGQHFKGTLYVFDNRITDDIVPTASKETIGACVFCSKPCETYYCDDSVKPSRRMICCDRCYKKRADVLRPSAAPETVEV